MGRYDGKASGGLCGAEALESCCTMAKQAEGCAMGRYDGKASGGLCDGKWCRCGGFWNCGKHIIGIAESISYAMAMVKPARAMLHTYGDPGRRPA